jgi:hypothetical protein
MGFYHAVYIALLIEAEAVIVTALLVHWFL